MGPKVRTEAFSYDISSWYGFIELCSIFQSVLQHKSTTVAEVNRRKTVSDNVSVAYLEKGMETRGMMVA